jgi:hypothetical protein
LHFQEWKKLDERKQTAGKASPFLGLFQKLKRSFKNISVDSEHFKSLGSSSWRKSAGKERYVKLALAVTRDRSTDITTPFASALYANVDNFIGAVYEKFTTQYIEEGLKPKERFFRKLYEPNSIYAKPLHYANLHDYFRYLEPRKVDLEHTGLGLDLYKRHRKALLTHWDNAVKLGEEDLVSYIEPNVNIGADLWISQNKKNFLKHKSDVLTRWFGKDFDFTVEGVVDMCEFGLANDIYLENTVFYRGKDSTSLRSVFGGPLPMKMVGAVIQALKAPGITYPGLVHGAQLPWGPWEDWSQYFPKLTSIVDECYENENLNAVGEDFIGFDQVIRPEDLRPLVLPINDKLTPIYNYVLKHLDNAPSYWGPYLVRDLYYVSGHPFTSELASGLHSAMALEYSKESGAEIKDGSVNSDDNLIIWKNIDVQNYYDWLGERGYEVKDKGSSNLREHGYARFLQNDIGRVDKHVDKSIFIGAFDSRYPKQIHLETGGEVLNWNITGELDVDRMISKLGSYGAYGAELVESTLYAIRNVEKGRQVIRAIQNMADYSVEPVRQDIVGFHPGWLTKVKLPEISLRYS